MKLLEIQSSVRVEGSVSRALSADFVAAWQGHNADATHTLRDVGLFPPSPPDDVFVKANYTPPAERSAAMDAALRPSETLIDELLEAQRLVLGVPMYNFGVPSGFKAYLDNVVRVGRTFDFDASTTSFTGLATGKKALVISPSAANYGAGEALAAMDFCGSYVRTILGFIGVTEVVFVPVPNQFAPPEVRAQIMDAARGQLVELARNW